MELVLPLKEKGKQSLLCKQVIMLKSS